MDFLSNRTQEAAWMPDLRNLSLHDMNLNETRLVFEIEAGS